MVIDSPPYVGSPSLVFKAQPLLCPPKPLVECVFPDTFVFPASLWTNSATGRSRDPSWTVDDAFRRLCTGPAPLYDLQSKKWTVASNVPNLLQEHHDNTEINFATFLNTIVTATVTAIGGDDKKVRDWSAKQAMRKLPGSISVRKPDIIAHAKGSKLDWRNVDCVVEMKNSKLDEDSTKEAQKDRFAWTELAERAKFIFSIQHDRRYIILLRNKRDEFSLSIFDRGGSITSPFENIQTQPLIFYRFVIAMTFAERRHIGYDTSIYRSPTGQRRIQLDFANESQGLEDLELQLILHMTGNVPGRGSTIRLLKVTDDRAANFYGAGGGNYKAPPGMKPGDKDFGIICKDAWEVPDLQDLSEGMILQLLHVKGVRGVIWCLDEKPVLAPDAPSLPNPTDQEPQPFLDNTLYIRSRWGIRTLRLPSIAVNALWTQEAKLSRTTAIPAESGHGMKQEGKGKDAEDNVSGGGGKGKGKGKRKGKGKKGKGKRKGYSLPIELTASTSTPSPPVPTPQGLPMVLDDLHATRCHVRSYLYPVGTPIFWFGNMLELICVLRDLVRTHQEACNIPTNGKRKTSFCILHRDLSPWNFTMVSQARSDWPVDREWSLQGLEERWKLLPHKLRHKIRRGLLIDWGFAALESSTGEELEEDDLVVYPPPDPGSSWLINRDVISNEAERERHCLAGVPPIDPEATFQIPPLWSHNENTGKLEANTHMFLKRVATDGELYQEWVNEALRTQEGVSTATGTWPFISLDVMAAWLLSKKLEIQSWHDLESIFISFTAICLWFQSPYHPKTIDEDSDIAWIFQSHSENEEEMFQSMYKKWERFGPKFEEKILGNLSQYFRHSAITGLLTEMRDMCIPPSFGDKVRQTPDGYWWPKDHPRASHAKMLEAIEKAILALLKDSDLDDMDSDSDLDEDSLHPIYTFDEAPPEIWRKYHANINADGIFIPPKNMEADTLPVVLDSYNSTSSQVKHGLFYRANPIGPDTRLDDVDDSKPKISHVLSATHSGPYSGKEEFRKRIVDGLAKRKYGESGETAATMASRMRGKKVKLTRRSDVKM